MPHVTELSAALQAALLPTSNALRIGVRCIFDPDGAALDLSNRLDFSAPVSISKSISILPYGQIGRYQVSEVRLRFINADGYFNLTNISSPFYYVAVRIITAKGSGDDFVELLKGDGPKFEGLTSVTLGQGPTATAFTIDSIDETDPNKDVINFTASGSFAAAAGTILETAYLPGTKVVLKTIVSDEATEITQFVGFMKGHPSVNARYAEMTLYDPLRQLLTVNLEATSAKILNDTAIDTVAYTRADASDGLLDNDQIDISYGCPIGEWKIVFTSATAFTITAPSGESQEEATSGDVYFPSTAGIFWVTIETGAWSGTFETGDEITFNTNCVLGTPLFNSTPDIPSMIKEVIVGEFGADMDLADVDEDAFDDLIAYYDEMFGKITFTEPTTALKAVELLQQHINGAVFFTNAGLISIFAYRPEYDDGSTFPTLSPDTDIRELAMEDLGRIEAVIARWNYSHVDDEFKNTVYIPDTDFDPDQYLEIRMPAAYSEAIARSAAERVWAMWRKGVRSYEIREKFNYGVSWEIGDIFRISSDHPSIPSRVVVIYDLRKDLRSGECLARAYDLNFAFNNFLQLDVGHELDTGKVLW